MRFAPEIAAHFGSAETSDRRLRLRDDLHGYPRCSQWRRLHTGSHQSRPGFDRALGRFGPHLIEEHGDLALALHTVFGLDEVNAFE